MAKFHGLLNLALVPVPSVVPGLPLLPARVTVTSLVSVSTMRIAWLPVSATYSLVPEMAKPIGFLNLALVPVASVVPEVPLLPARVVTSLASVSTMRIAWLYVSATYSLVPEMAKPLGAENWALVPVPSVVP